MNIPALHSTLRPEALATVVAAEYDLGGAVSCAVWYRGFNDYYLVEAPSGRFVLRVYATDKYWMPDESDVRFELDLLAHLNRTGVPVLSPVRRRDGDVVSTVKAPEGQRHAALFPFAPGSPKQLDIESARTLGEVCARIHESASAFTSQHRRYHLDADLLLEMPVREVAKFRNGSRTDDVETIRRLADRVRKQIEVIPKQEPFYGVIHADLHFANCRWAEGGLTVLDFDHCGYGWRAYDLVAGIDGVTDDVRGAYLEGYRSVREISQEELDLLPAFREARYVWACGNLLAMVDHLAARGQLADAWDGYFGKIREMLENKHV